LGSLASLGQDTIAKITRLLSLGAECKPLITDRLLDTNHITTNWGDHPSSLGIIDLGTVWSVRYELQLTLPIGSHEQSIAFIAC
jgi:hypothetical protein